MASRATGAPFRGSPAAVRSGEGLWVRQTNDKWFVVVVDDAHTAAALLGDLIAQRAGREG